MRIILGVILVFVVSGEEETTHVNGFLGESVLLPCPCTDKEEFEWQMEFPKLQSVYNKTTSEFNGRYQGRAKISENNNCSIVLTNITASDQGIYKCIPSPVVGLYKRRLVQLHISASYNICQKVDKTNGNTGLKEFHCYVHGRYGDAEIQWNLTGQLLTNSTTTNITYQTNTHSASTGLYHFNSTLITKLNVTSEPTCHVKAKNISTHISHDCVAVFDLLTSVGITEQKHVIMRYFKLIPIVLVLGFSLVLWRRWKFSQRFPKIPEVDTAKGLC